MINKADRFKRLTAEVIRRVLSGDTVAAVLKEFDENREKEPTKSWLGYRLDTEAAHIDALLVKGATLEQICDQIKRKNDERSDAEIRKRVKSHFPWLKNHRGLVVSVDDKGIYMFDRAALGISNQKAAERSRQSESKTRSNKKGANNSVASVETDLSRIAQELEAEGYFSPDTLEDERERQLRAIVQRHGQPAFRTKLIAAYQGRCAVTGCDAVDALEAAHLDPYCGPKSNYVSNGVLLRADIHTLFDLGRIGFDPKTLAVRLGQVLQDTIYRDLQGQRLKLPRAASHRPHPQALAKRWKRFLENEGRRGASR